jgi:hypothetical protein
VVFLYHAARSLFVLLTLFCRSERSKELEILVLRHELAILRRQSRRPKFEPADRALLAAVSRALPWAAWSTFSVRPETLLRWHRQLVAQRWTYPQKKPGRPQLERPRRELTFVSRARTRTGAISGSPVSSRASGSQSLRLLYGRCSFALGCRRRPGGHANRGARSCASRRPARWRVTSSRSRRLGCSGSMCSSSSRWRRGSSSSSPARTPNPHGTWVTQRARNLVMQLGEQERPNAITHP